MCTWLRVHLAAMESAVRPGRRSRFGRRRDRAGSIEVARRNVHRSRAAPKCEVSEEEVGAPVEFDGEVSRSSAARDRREKALLRISAARARDPTSRGGAAEAAVCSCHHRPRDRPGSPRRRSRSCSHRGELPGRIEGGTAGGFACQGRTRVVEEVGRALMSTVAKPTPPRFSPASG